VQARECQQKDLDFLRERSLNDSAAANELIEKAKQLSGAAVVQVLRPGDRLPFVFKSDRLLLQLDAEGRVGRFWCG